MDTELACRFRGGEGFKPVHSIHLAMTKSVLVSLGRRMCSFFAAVLASLILCHQAEAQAPDSIGGYTIVVTITNATAPFATSGVYHFLPSGADNSYAVVRISGDTEGSVGTYTYSKQSATTATLSFVDSGIGAGADQQLVFNSPRQGTFSLTLPSVPGAIQQGFFVAHRGISPANIAGTIVTTTITEGTGQFATSGSTRFQPKADNTYTNEALFGNVVSSSGTYTYTKNSDSGAEFSMNDSETGAEKDVVKKDGKGEINVDAAEAFDLDDAAVANLIDGKVLRVRELPICLEGEDKKILVVASQAYDA